MGRPLLFDWPGRHHVQVLLPAAFVLALIAHAGVFFLFSVVYPPAQTNGPDAVQVNFLLPGSPEADRAQTILSVQNPMLFAPGRGLPEGPLPRAEFRPGYASRPLPLEGMPERPRQLPVESRPVGIVRVDPPVEPLPLTRRYSVTHLSASGTLRERIPSNWTGSFSIPPRFVPAPARFLVAVRPDGSVAHLFLQESSGNGLLDAAASRALAATAFEAAPAGLVWGMVTVNWGGDIRVEDEP